MKIKKIFDLRTSGSGCQDYLLQSNGADTLILYNFTLNDKFVTGGFKFCHSLSFKRWNEMSTPVIYDDSYDCIVELIDSEWLAEIKTRRTKNKNDAVKMRHFAVYMSNIGLQEIIAEDVIEMEIIPGEMDFEL